MIDFSKFYTDIGFVAALFYNNLLTNEMVLDIADVLTQTENNDILIDILVSRYKDDNLKKIEEYIKSKNMYIKDKKRFLIKKTFQYILNGEISLNDGIRFINFEIIDREKTNMYLGDDVGVEQILGNFWAINDGDVTDTIQIKQLEKEINHEMKTYINS
ncbi:MAG: hypothetical protein LBH92_03570 [Bacteroidales bacterium]|jgi:hypothetical protein|nr:hypothetical protein [Bacteroidales bacterium]